MGEKLRVSSVTHLLSHELLFNYIVILLNPIDELANVGIILGVEPVFSVVQAAIYMGLRIGITD